MGFHSFWPSNFRFLFLLVSFSRPLFVEFDGFAAALSVRRPAISVYFKRRTLHDGNNIEIRLWGVQDSCSTSPLSYKIKQICFKLIPIDAAGYFESNLV